ncbi:MAG: tRNA pseudouridine(55) synthase TruB [Defluviitaleaceae bacterium]|nr:tRNA pseudouridine(55) synthase TruB [Defluviitaleaceae bacterium]
MYNGIINIYKQRGFTSNDVVQVVKKLTKSKAGHTGTLDPQATGVLPICLGKATKIADYIMGADKQYIAKVVLGSSTDTQDAHGVATLQSSKRVAQGDIEAVLTHFFGEILQLPPMYSAIKVDGKRLYEQARAGIDVERKPRQIFIHNLEVLRWNLDDFPQSFVLRVDCSKGTYIRTLCNDLGEQLGCFAHMGDLLRTKSGNFGINNAITLDKLRKIMDNGNLDRYLLPMEDALSHLPMVNMTEEAQKYIENGNKLEKKWSINNFNDGTYLIIDYKGDLVGIYRCEDDILKPITMLRI